MFAEHQPKLSVLGRSGPEGFERVCTFVLLTIRMPLRDAVADYRLLRRGEHNVRALFGAKHQGLAYVREHVADLWQRCEDAFENMGDDDAADLIVRIIAEVPGLGVTKAGFVAQIIYGLSGCIDTHNLARFNLPERHFRYEKKWKAERKAEVVATYNTFCRKVGGTAALWDGWCSYLADRNPINYMSAETVSALHLVPLEC